MLSEEVAGRVTIVNINPESTFVLGLHARRTTTLCHINMPRPYRLRMYSHETATTLPSRLITSGADDVTQSNGYTLLSASGRLLLVKG